MLENEYSRKAYRCWSSSLLTVCEYDKIATFFSVIPLKFNYAGKIVVSILSNIANKLSYMHNEQYVQKGELIGGIEDPYPLMLDLYQLMFMDN